MDQAPINRPAKNCDRLNARIAAMPKPSATARARKIKLILFDVDGVLTDGKIWIFPAPSGASQSGAQQSVLEKSAQGFSRPEGQGGFGLHSTSLIEAKGWPASRESRPGSSPSASPKPLPCARAI